MSGCYTCYKIEMGCIVFLKMSPANSYNKFLAVIIGDYVSVTVWNDETVVVVGLAVKLSDGVRSRDCS